MASSPRCGSLLIVVAGLSALLMSITLIFLMRIRSAAEESAAVLREAEAHIMLVAACNYIQEASRAPLYAHTIFQHHIQMAAWLSRR